MTTPTPQVTELNSRFGIDDALTFDCGLGGLPRAKLKSSEASAEVYLHGAHLTGLRLGDEAVLFLARGAKFAPGSSIRGGVPICHPWFGARAGVRDAPSHGLARTHDWEVVEARAIEEGVKITFGSTFENFETLYSLTLTDHLVMTLDATNRSAEPTRLEQALHSYFRVADIREVELRGLEGTTYLDQLQDRMRRVEGDVPLTFAAETDRVYLETSKPRSIVDPGLGRRIDIETEGARSTVVWNPWADKTARMGDLADSEWPTFLCVETGSVADDALEVKAGASHRLSTTVTTQPLG